MNMTKHVIFYFEMKILTLELPILLLSIFAHIFRDLDRLFTDISILKIEEVTRATLMNNLIVAFHFKG